MWLVDYHTFYCACNSQTCTQLVYYFYNYSPSRKWRKLTLVQWKIQFTFLSTSQYGSAFKNGCQLGCVCISSVVVTIVVHRSYTMQLLWVVGICWSELPEGSFIRYNCTLWCFHRSLLRVMVKQWGTPIYMPNILSIEWLSRIVCCLLSFLIHKVVLSWFCATCLVGIRLSFCSVAPFGPSWT